MIRSGSAAAATAYFKNPAAGAAVDGVFEIVLSWFHYGETSQTELQIMQSKLNDQFNRLSKEISEVKRDIAELSQKLDEKIENILNKIDESFEAYYAKTQVTDFLYSTSGNFSYNLIRNYLYGAGQYSLYADLATALANQADDKTVNELYNKLYYALMHHNLASGEKSNLDKFTEYFVGDANRKSISHYYFEYLNSNQSYIDENASYLAMEFASQVYFDYVSMLNIIRMINTYQLSEIYLNNSDLSAEEMLNAKYYYGTGTYDYVTANDIENLNVQLNTLAQDAYKQMLVDVEDILGLSKSYLVEEKDGLKRYVVDNNFETFANLVKDETIYLNQVITPYCNMFALDPTLFEYEFKSGEQLLVNNKKLGYYKVGEVQNFTGTVIYDGTILYTIEFRVGDNTKYAGGSGTATDPYVIATKEQYKLMYNETKNDKSYLLVADIDFAGETINPLSSEFYPFNGTFNGAGHAISNGRINYKSENATSIFGVIGNSGIVKYLEIKGFEVIEDKDNDAKKISTGILAGTNNGQIISCFINSSAVRATRDSDIKNDNLNKAITIFVGAIAGENNGVITYCKVVSTTASAESKRFYSANKDSDNSNCVYSGGIVGANNYGYIENCYVAENVTVTAYGECQMDEGLSFRYPYMTIQAGGVAGVVSSLKTIKKVYSLVTNLYTGKYVKNRAKTGGSFYSHCNEYTDAYVPNQKDADLNTIKASSSDIYKIDTNNKKIKYEFKTGGDTGAVVDPDFECSTDLIYVGTDTKFKLNNLKLTLVMSDGEKETEIDSCLSIIGIYGFNVQNTDTEKDYLRKITLNIYDSLNNSIYTINLGYYVKRNSVYKIELPDGYNNKFNYNSQVPTDIYGALQVNELWATYHDGTRVNVAEDAIFTVDTSTLGATVGKLSYGDFEVDIDCSIVCDELYDTEEIEIISHILSEDKQTCKIVGYKTSYCSLCGKMEVENIEKVFNVVMKNATESTCSVAGYTGDLCILADNIVLFEDVLLEKGTYLPLKEHNFDYERTNSIDYRDEHYHYCIDCHHQEAHMFRTIENSNQVICECVVCKYQTTLEIVDREQIAKLPRVVVSNAYAVTSTREVKVFIDLHASTGITAANFTVNFDPELKLVSYKLGNILNGKDSIDTFKVYADHLNVTLVQSGTDYKTDGTILALTFRLPENPILSNKYIVEVTNKDNKDKFTDQNGNKTDFISYSGGIIVVSHLPGDINGDNTLNLVDTVILSNYITLDSNDQIEFITQMLAKNPNFDISYGDVNLDGSIDISDAVQILRYTTGGYETTFVSNIFEITLNYDNGTEMLGSFFVRFDGGNSTFGSLQSLPELQKIGYKFDGWYTEFGGKGIKVTNDTPVFYNTAQYKQTLYAHFVPNTITFNANSGQGYKQSLNYLSTFDLSNTYNGFYSYFTKESLVEFNGNGIGPNSSITKTYTFLGWAFTPNGPVVYTEDDIIDLRLSGYNGVGQLTLYAVWSEEIIPAYKPSVEGYTFLGWTGSDKKTVVWTGEYDYNIYADITLYAKWRKNSFSFVYNGANDQVHTETITRDIDNYTQPLWTNTFSRDGYDFLGWSLTENATTADFANESVLTNEQILIVMDYIDNIGYVNLYAVWQGHQYHVAFDKNSSMVTGSIDAITTRYGNIFALPSSSAYTAEAHKHFAGWSIYPNGEIIYLDQQEISNLTTVENATITLYAQWEYDTFEIVYTVSRMAIHTDIVSYNSSYNFKTAFEEYQNYEVIRYLSENIELGQHIEHWIEERNFCIQVELAYNNADNKFVHSLYDGSKRVVISGYNGQTDGNLIIPHYIKNGSDLYSVVAIQSYAFASNQSRQLNFESIYIPNSVETIMPEAFFGTRAKNVYLLHSVREIYRHAFSEMLYVDNFVMPMSALDYVAYGTRITNLYYLGTVEQWNNSSLQNGVNYENLYFYYTSGPTIVGYKYWKYENGTIVTFNG